MRRLNRWYEGLSTWKFAAITAVIMLCALAAGDYVLALATGHSDVWNDITYAVVFTATLTAGLTWRQQERQKRRT